MNSKFRSPIILAVLLFLANSFAVAQEPTHKLTPPRNGQKLRVAFVITEDAVVIDFTGPWEVFQDVMIPARGESMDDQQTFQLYTVSDSTAPVTASDGMKIVPDYSFDNAPTPNVVVVPAQSGRSPKMLAWIRKMTKQSDVVMSVCTGAFVLAEAGLLNGKHATTHHGSLNRLQHRYPQISVDRGVRYVQSDPVIFTAGGLSSGIDLALHVVELYFGRDAAQATADIMEYEGHGWMGNGKSSRDFSAVAPNVYPSDVLTEGMLGRWAGIIVSGNDKYHILLHIWSEDGTLGGALDSPDQEAFGLGISALRLDGNKLSFNVPGVNGSFEGTLDDAVIHGTWKQGTAALKLDLSRAAVSASAQTSF